MFEGVAVDGSSSCILGEIMADMDDGAQEQDLLYGAESPMSTSSFKRPSSTNTSANSPKRRGKGPLVKIMNGMRDIMQQTANVAQKAMQQTSKQEELRSEAVKAVMRLAVESGARPGTDEHFMASKLFIKAEHRDVFLTLENSEDRLVWLKRWCKEKEKNVR